MSPRRRQERDDEPAPGPLEFAEQRDLDALMEVQEALDELPSDAIINVFRQDEVRKQYAWIGALAPSEFSVSYVGRRWGGGKYKIIPKYRAESGKIVFGKDQRVFDIDKSVEPDPALQPKGRDGGGVGSVIEQGMAGLMQLQMQMMQTMISAMSVPKPDHAMELLKVMLANRTERDPLDAAAKLLELTGQGRSAKEAIAELREIYREGMDDGRASAGGDDGYGAVVRELGKPLVEMIGRATGNAPSGGTVNSPGRELPPGAKPLPEWLQPLAPYLGIIVGMARASVNPDVVVDLILDRAPEYALERIKAVAAVPMFYDEALAALPPVLGQQHQAWSRSVLERLVAALNESGTEPEPEAG